MKCLQNLTLEDYFKLGSSKDLTEMAQLGK